ncbi:hypothetical protein BDN72DRAFT_916487 [Pluteus cervinus]|uniref:Uncharacterized protein n=1 Tax=Pluteus cervinus TaxID=181527 RepID=A0ACD2ZYH1_9AGAR|nr:hypothetical protein BDN72DRAFT_916487 [Pluteus cervinus]
MSWAAKGGKGERKKLTAAGHERQVPCKTDRQRAGRDFGEQKEKKKKRMVHLNRKNIRCRATAVRHNLWSLFKKKKGFESDELQTRGGERGLKKLEGGQLNGDGRGEVVQRLRRWEVNGMNRERGGKEEERAYQERTPRTSPLLTRERPSSSHRGAVVVCGKGRGVEGRRCLVRERPVKTANVQTFRNGGTSEEEGREEVVRTRQETADVQKPNHRHVIGSTAPTFAGPEPKPNMRFIRRCAK